MSSPRRSRSPSPPPGTSPTTSSTNAREAGATAVFSRPTEQGWADVTAAEFHDEVRAVAKGLIAAGVEAGDRVALLSKTRYEWTLFDYAIWFAGAVTVPIYETSSAEQIGWILQDSGARADRGRGSGAPGPACVRPAHPVTWSELQHVWSTPGQRRRRARPARIRHPGRDTRGAAHVCDTARPGHADLHERHDRQAQGLHAHARQLHVRARAWPSTSSTSSSTPTRHRPALLAAGPRLRPHHPGRMRQEPHHDGPQLRHQEPGGRPRRVQADLHPRRAPRLREGLQHRLPARHRRRSRRDLRPSRRRGHRLVARARRKTGARAAPSPARGLRQARLRQAPPGTGRLAAPTPSPAARHSANGSATSTAASA